jgi:hypothetical protein
MRKRKRWPGYTRTRIFAELSSDAGIMVCARDDDVAKSFANDAIVGSTPIVIV